MPTSDAADDVDLAPPGDDKTFVLEVVRFIRDHDEWMVKGSKHEHVGYMRANFCTKEAAATYYDRHNPHMRRLNAFNTWKSDWDPDTSLLYIVRENHHMLIAHAAGRNVCIPGW